MFPTWLPWRVEQLDSMLRLVFVGIYSARKNFEKRQAVRETQGLMGAFCSCLGFSILLFAEPEAQEPQDIRLNPDLAAPTWHPRNASTTHHEHQLPWHWRDSHIEPRHYITAVSIMSISCSSFATTHVLKPRHTHTSYTRNVSIMSFTLAAVALARLARRSRGTASQLLQTSSNT